MTAALLPALLQAATPVTVAIPETGQATQTLSLSGNLTPRQASRLSPQVPGLVAEMRVDAGDTASAGDILVKLEARSAELEEARARAVLGEAQAALAEARRLRDEGRRLLERRVLPDSEVQAREAALQLAEATVARAQAELAIARERVLQHVVRAPFDGVVSQRLAEAGEWVGTGTAVLELVAVDDLWLDVRVPQQFWNRLGDQVELAAFAEALPGQALDAKVNARVPVNDPAARTFLLRLLVHDESGRLTPGMSARVEIAIPGGQAATLVPRDAILRYPDGTTTLWLALPQDGGWVARQAQVEVLRLAGANAELAGALPPGARVVTRGNEGLAEGESLAFVDAP
ncbi:efflux RND transporter periplasmic adaptor subunit [Thioalkalivibrio sp. XN279]|uniref:efflux RND transporter periplasmic adaptor subunit n=1 Tax=Thioalkalivibrio sp. XN279 TaxID=2714953 RepID=UPI00140B2E74|nr:efflux RND transporter periplasmic adaptor subunit [Thioalkalivibrio sp. XN279]NHA15101.1 efflux RND transporter periplasmic adaptor subunit [Thioalkalivibrio sp. XN279]